jgi:DNA-binding Lrp family transcriptional regulator
MDEIDQKLLGLLATDARRPAAELARDLGVSRSTVQNRIDRLQANGTIARFTIELGKEADTTLIEALVLIKLTSGDSRSTVLKLKALPEVESLASANGSYDFIVELRTTSLKKLDQLLMDIRRLPTVLETNSSIRLNRFK